MRNNTFLVITILLVGGLFCLGIKKWGNTTPFPDHRGTKFPTSNIQQMSNRQPATGFQPSVSSNLSGKSIVSTSYSRGTKLHTNTPQTYGETQLQGFAKPRSAQYGNEYRLHSSASAQTHSIGDAYVGATSISASRGSAIGNNRSGYSATITSLALPSSGSSQFLALNNATMAEENLIARKNRSLPRIGYTTANNDSGDTRRKIYRGEEPDEDGEYYDPELGEWVKAPTGDSNITGLGAGQFTGQEAIINGITYVWNGSTWDKKATNPSEVDYPLGNGAWLLLLLAAAYAVKIRRKGIAQRQIKKVIE